MIQGRSKVESAWKNL